MKITPDLRQRWIPDADAVVATLWNTAERISTYGNRKGKKFYFIQGLDTVFNQTIPSRVMDTWKLPFHKIVVSQWLEQIARNRGEECTYIPNGINFSEFNIDMPIEKRDPKTLCIVHKEDTFKGTADGLKALKMVKEKVPDISVIMFGVGPQPPLPSLPITYYLNPSPSRTRNLFNKASIFIGTSWCEGFGLPPCEAAACGAALCVADNGGHREFAVHGNTALVHPPRQPGVLAENILCLLNDNEKRIKIARAGNSYVKRFSWKWSTEEFERTIQKRIAP
jgi:glycosyltransferase involved in cell wall biosynthesis